MEKSDYIIEIASHPLINKSSLADCIFGNDGSDRQSKVKKFANRKRFTEEEIENLYETFQDLADLLLNVVSIKSERNMIYLVSEKVTESNAIVKAIFKDYIRSISKIENVSEEEIEGRINALVKEYSKETMSSSKGAKSKVREKGKK